ncbi:hypothetical protein V5E97_31000 [Singulisphaera sp. Ch08]|uniref:Uncharacterized protein n=1 Tax=Singulisphaera sp. Ch08 TaxID=3120278 RepID=A0AAU7CCN6_9BACT
MWQLSPTSKHKHIQFQSTQLSRTVRQLVDSFHAAPGRLREQHVGDYFLHIENDRKFATTIAGNPTDSSGRRPSRFAFQSDTSMRFHRCIWPYEGQIDSDATASCSHR